MNYSDILKSYEDAIRNVSISNKRKNKIESIFNIYKQIIKY